MLYQGMEKELSAALKCFEADERIVASNIETYGKHIMKAQEIINELQVSLDMERGGAIAQNLMSLYMYFNQELTAANINQDKRKLTFVVDMVRQLSAAWETADGQTNTANQTVQKTLNIKG